MLALADWGDYIYLIGDATRGSPNSGGYGVILGNYPSNFGSDLVVS